MKKPSDTKLSHSLPEPTYFTDRDLGKALPRILGDRGLRVERYCDHYGERIVGDHIWLALTAEKGWIALSHDNKIRGDQLSVEAVMTKSGRLFIIRGVLTSPGMADLFVDALAQVKKIIAENACFIAVVRRKLVPGGTLVADVDVRLTPAKWKARRDVDLLDEEESVP